LNVDSKTHPRFSLVQRTRYRFDNALTRGVSLILVWLGIVTLVLILVVAFVEWIWSIGPEDSGVPYHESVWLALTRILDPGTFGGDTGTRFRLMMLGVTLVGILFLAVVIGLVSNSIDRKLENLRQGRSLVVETGHTLILGYSQKVPAIVRELTEANLSRRKPAVAILSEMVPEVVHDSMRDQGIDMRTTRLVVRRGNPSSMEDLARLNAGYARSIIVVAPEEEAADSIVVKNTLALKRFEGGRHCPVVAEVSDRFIATALTEIGGGDILTVNPLTTVSRITARILRSSGVGAVYEELLSFEGNEIYTTAIPATYDGCTFGELLLASRESSIVGLIRSSEIMVMPNFDLVVEAGDIAIAVSADDASLVLDQPTEPMGPVTEVSMISRVREHTLVIGWSRLGAEICQDNESHVLEGSRITVLVDPELHDTDALQREIVLERQAVEVIGGNPVQAIFVDQVLEKGPYDHILVLAERDRLNYHEADARALLSLLHVRRWYDRQPTELRRPNMVGELLDVNDEVIGEIARPDDFIVSERLVSLALAQLSENPEIYPVLRTLLDAEGVQLLLIGSDIVDLAHVANFADVVIACRSVGAIAIGCQLDVSEDGSTSKARIVVNPDKRAPLMMGPHDRAVVLARM